VFALLPSNQRSTYPSAPNQLSSALDSSLSSIFSRSGRDLCQKPNSKQLQDGGALQLTVSAYSPTLSAARSPDPAPQQIIYDCRNPLKAFASSTAFLLSLHPDTQPSPTMRLAVGSLSGALALAAQGACAHAFDTGHQPGARLPPVSDRLGALAGILGRRGPDTAAAESPVLAAQEFTETRILETTVTKPQPRITEAPNLVRKLGSNKWDVIHDAIQGRKRDATVCPSDYQLCPQSLNGGCCPNDRSCGTNSCYATTSAPALACGLVGYASCAMSLGGELSPNALWDTIDHV
jgi:hypothetical protein